MLQELVEQSNVYLFILGEGGQLDKSLYKIK
jgi:hypothetical protein